MPNRKAQRKVLGVPSNFGSDCICFLMVKLLQRDNLLSFVFVRDANAKMTARLKCASVFREMKKPSAGTMYVKSII